MSSNYRRKDTFKVTTSRGGLRTFGDHDDRSTSPSRSYDRSSSPPRSSWRGGAGGGKNRRRGNRGYRGRGRGGGGGRRGGPGSPNPRSRLEDDDGDVAMDDAGNAGGAASRYAPYGQRPSSRRGYRNDDRSERSTDNRGKLARLGLPLGGRGRSRNSRERNDLPWMKIFIPYGKNHSKDWLLSSIQNLCSVPFQVIDFHYIQETASFYVDDKRTGYAISDVSRKITTREGQKVIINVKAVAPLAEKYRKLSEPLTEPQMEILKQCMSKRYDVQTHALNLSNLLLDNDLKSNGIQAILSRESVMKSVIKIIVENIPQITALDLSDNKLYGLDNLKDLVGKVPLLRNLSLAKNQLRHVRELEKISGFKLEELTLDGNPFCEHFRDETTYISAVRSSFRKLIKLDGHELPPTIGFDIDNVTEVLPDQQGSYYINDQLKSLVCTFLQQYYNVYDSDNRQSLLDAYHEKACFSLTIPPTNPRDPVAQKMQSLHQYTKLSRNLQKVPDAEFRNRLLKTTKLSVVAFLNELPDTQHDPASFVVDMNLQTPTLLSFTVSGLFKETGGRSSQPPIRAFSRTFQTVPAGPGLCIINDQLYIRHPSSSQLKGAFTTPAPTPSTSPVPPEIEAQVQSLSSQAAAAAAVISTVATPQTQQDMTQSFSQQSGMNLEWSQKCLAENNWDYEKSARVFTDLHMKGSIPPEAFAK